MALNAQTFRTRTLTAIVFVAVMALGLLLGHWTFLLLFTIIHFGAWIEFQRLLTRIVPAYGLLPAAARYGFIAIGWSMMVFAAASRFGPFGRSLTLTGWCVLAGGMLSVVIGSVGNRPRLQVRNAGYSLFGLLYISLSLSLMLRLLPPLVPHATFLPVMPLFIIACMWINDTMAYVVGSLIGKTPLSEISPKKTWEGTVGGIILCVAIIAAISRHIPVLRDYPAPEIAVLAFIAAVAGTFGDLLESKIKRMADVKDSGSVMPGHGGFLDRFDSLLLATPFVWLYLVFVLS